MSPARHHLLLSAIFRTPTERDYYRNRPIDDVQTICIQHHIKIAAGDSCRTAPVPVPRCRYTIERVVPHDLPLLVMTRQLARPQHHLHHLHHASRHHPIPDSSRGRPTPGGRGLPCSQPVAQTPPRGLPGPAGRRICLTGRSSDA